MYTSEDTAADVHTHLHIQKVQYPYMGIHTNMYSYSGYEGTHTYMHDAYIYTVIFILSYS
jgi:hypothetical protein